MISEIEIKAEVFKVIRANQHLKPKAIRKLIIKQLPDVDLESIQKAISELRDE